MKRTHAKTRVHRFKRESTSYRVSGNLSLASPARLAYGLREANRPQCKRAKATRAQELADLYFHFGIPIRFYSRPVRNSLPGPAFNPDFATSHNSDLTKPGVNVNIDRI
ncbi:hypothetical protein EVAR_53487_1 [Eumeta japonica]|uniref:Uncharacterized protein n=1 Tax=Eumeta variegata TaxID=151549 RepID=A0A4C1YRB0_EUMVA|nr:hypothetical protein EVAR_53487_1 [Eumeta japonica]